MRTYIRIKGHCIDFGFIFSPPLLSIVHGVNFIFWSGSRFHDLIQLTDSRVWNIFCVYITG